MGAVQSDLKATIVQASARGVVIPPGDNDFWQTFWKRPETAEHVFETFTPTDIRGMRDDPKAVENFKTLIIKTCLLIVEHRLTARSLSEDDSKLGLEVLNCVRILTRVLPYVYETDVLGRWENETFWRQPDTEVLKQYDAKISRYVGTEDTLGYQLVESLLGLLFYNGFTLPWPESDTTSSRDREGVVTYGLWQSGIACDTTVVSNREFESKRTEILQLLITLQSKGIYLPSSAYIQSKVEAIDCVTRYRDKRRIQALLCSLLNTIVKYHPDSWLPFDPRNPQGDPSREVHVRTCLHFLLVNLLNRAPWDDSGKSRNELRLQLSYLHMPKHFQFLADGIFRTLRQPLDTSSNVLPIAQRTIDWTPEMILLQWEALYTNRKYLHYIVESGRALDLLVLMLYYAKESQLEGIGRVCIFSLQTLSAEPAFGLLLNRTFEAHESIPASIQIKNFHGRYSDFFILSILSLLDSAGNEAGFWSAALMAMINNVAPHVTDLARPTCSKSILTFARMSKPPAIFAGENTIALLKTLLEAINTLIEYHEMGHENENVLYAVWRARDRFESLRELCLLGSDELMNIEMPVETPSSPTSIHPSSSGGDVGVTTSEKSRGKRPNVESSTVSQQITAQLATLPLHTPLTLITQLNENMGDDGDVDLTPMHSATSAIDSRRSSLALKRPGTHRSLSEVIASVREAGSTGIERGTPVVEVFHFQPQIAALYASYYWGLVVSQDLRRASDTGKGIWVGTKIKLFNIKAGQVQGPTLWSPKGAVDAVGESLVAGVKDLTMRARKGMGRDAG